MLVHEIYEYFDKSNLVNVDNNNVIFMSRSSVQVLSRPLAQLHLDVGVKTSSASTCRKIAENVVAVLMQVIPNPVNLIMFPAFSQNHGLIVEKKKDFDAGNEIRWSRGIGLLFFLIAEKSDFRSYVPSCYSPIFLFNQVSLISSWRE